HDVDEAVRAHDCADVRLADGRLERRQIDLVQRAVVDVRGDVVPVRLLAVDRVVLDGGDYRVLLDAPDLRHGRLRAEEWVLAERLEVPSVLRDSGDVDVRSEQDVDALLPRLEPHRPAERLLQPGSHVAAWAIGAGKAVVPTCEPA